MIPKPLNDITEADVLQLKAAGIQEGKTIEYKREVPGTRDEDKREFLADISSFANTEGGDLIYGVEEDRGVITEIVGVPSPDVDAEILRLENLVRDGVSPRMTASFRAVPCTAGKVMIIRVERSWIGPHRVIFRGHDKFYGRTSAGKFALDVSQLRAAFLQSATLAEQINTFRVDRIIDIANDRAPVPLVKAPTLVLHVIPFGALWDQVQFDVTIFYKNPTLHKPWDSYGWDKRMTFDGALLWLLPDVDGRFNGYTHFFRNGILEGVNTCLLEAHLNSGQRVIPHVRFEGQLVEYLPRCFQSLQQIGIRPPVSVSLTLINVRGLRMAMPPLGFDYGKEIREETLFLPPTTVENLSIPAPSVLRPMYDRVWNACGLLTSPNFDAQGNWAPKSRW
jgi:Putative DNA-binding domain